ncbi:MAG: HlyD family efflux transporter periplasmic adaptor subunit [Actinobacteria bacterium]|nr:HlyD family efflux transporter periplasmic adaptor subunit [Actinomycetota bacterium]
MVLAILLGVSGLAVFVTGRAVFSDDSLGASAQIEPVSTIDLNFAATAPVTEVNVKPGDRVLRGQTLAKQDDHAFQAQLAADQAAMAADQARVLQVQGPLRPAERAQLTLLVDEAGSRLQAARQALDDMKAVQGNSVATAATRRQSAQSTLTTDQSQATRVIDCSGSSGEGSFSAQSTTSSAPARRRRDATTTTVESRAATTAPDAASSDFCQRSAHQVAADEAELAAAEQAYAQAVAARDAALHQAGSAVDAAAARVAVVQGQRTVGLLAGTDADVAAAQALVEKDVATIAADQLELQRAVLIAPSDGIVATVGAAVGELGSDAGVRNFSEPEPTAQASTGFRLFGAEPTASATQASAFSPVVTLQSEELKVVAQVPERSLRRFRVGREARITVPAVPGQRFTGRVTGVTPTPVNRSGHVYFLVELSVEFAQSRRGVLPGMTADVSLT